MTNIELLHKEVRKTRVATPQVTEGKAYWLVARRLFGDKVRPLRGTDVDPYNHDERVDAFVKALEEILCV